MDIGLDTTLSVGDMLKIAFIGGGWIVTIVKIDGRLKNVEKDIREVIGLTKWRERIEERLLTQRRDIDELRHGRGYVQREIDGEYDRDGKIGSADA